MISCVIRKADGSYLIYREKGDIYSRRLYNGLWGRAESIACNVRGGFSVVRDPFCEPAVIYMNRGGRLMLSGVGIRERCISDNAEDAKGNIYAEMIKTGESVRIIYYRGSAMPCIIAERHRNADKSWSYPCTIDVCEGEGMPRLISVEENCVLFYTKKAPENQLGYREIHGGGIGSFKMVYATGYGIRDYSLALTRDELHICIVISAGRLNRLVYVRRDRRGISKPVVIGEGIIHGCQLSVCRSKPTVVFSTPKGNNILSSYDNGYSFKRVSGGEAFSFNKIPLIDYTLQYADGYSATELVSRSDMPCDIKYCPFIREP